MYSCNGIFSLVNNSECYFKQVFRALEYPAEMAKQEFHRERLLTERWNLIRFVSERSNGTDNDGVEKLLSDHLAVYERVIISQKSI